MARITTSLADELAESPAIHTESYNVCPDKLSDWEYRVGWSGSGKVKCHCGREFRPDFKGQRFCDSACYSASLRSPIQDRFWSKVNKFGSLPADASLGRCWLWTAATIRGYGQIAGVVNGKRRPVYAHRVAWEMVHGPITGGLSVLHKCDVPLCVNFQHLFLGTLADNLADARAKGRLDESQPRTRGALTPEIRQAIFDTPDSPGIGSALARRYSVSKSCISAIRRGRFARVPDVAQPRAFGSVRRVHGSKPTTASADRPRDFVVEVQS